MPDDISKIIERVFHGSAAADPERLKPEKLEQRELLMTQILSLGVDLGQDAAFTNWGDAELEELLGALIAAQSGSLEEEGDEKERKSDIKSETHVPGVNDLMSGALPPRRLSESGDSDMEEDDDATVSLATLPRLYRSMPHYMVSVNMLKSLDLFSNPTICDVLPDNFFTTIKGLKRAWDEADARQPNVTEDIDGYLFEAMLKRGGQIQNAYCGVKYPSDIMPLTDEQGDPDFWKEIRDMDWTVEEKREREAIDKRRYHLNRDSSLWTSGEDRV